MMKRIMDILPMLWLLWLTVLRVEQRWSEADVILASGLPWVCGTAWLISMWRGHGRVTAVDILVMTWAVYYVIRVWCGGEFSCAVECLRVMVMVVLYVGLRMWWGGHGVMECGLPLGIILGGSVEAVMGLMQMMNGTSRHHLYVLTGSFLNPGPYSAYLMMGGVMGTAWLRSGVLKCDFVVRLLGNCKLAEWLTLRNLVLSLTLLMLVVLPSTWSRAAIVGVVVCVLLIFHDLAWKYRYWLAGAFAVVIVGLYFVKQGSADGRMMTWQASLRTWSHVPWLGVGVGGFCHATAEGYCEMLAKSDVSCDFASAGVAEYPCNEFLKVLVEQGVVGAVLCVVTVAVAMFRLFVGCRVLFWGMCSMILFSMFSYPMSMLPYCVIVIMVIAWNESGKNIGVFLRCNRIMTTFVAIVVAGGGCWLAHEVGRRHEIDSECRLFSGMRNAAFINDYYELMPEETDNPQFLFDFGTVLREQKRYSDSNAVMRMGTRVSADPMFYVVMGNNYADMEEPDEAGMCYMKASGVMPNRLYPLYKLMMMYNDLGDREKTLYTAQRIIESMPKIPSKATRRMQERASQIKDSLMMTDIPKRHADMMPYVSGDDETR
ncbi:MAG: O-antigen ligase family protein [Bacteroidaceae bacterium]|nr:O-antigen ligase family protein [Bacteroidaceae bacterium]